MSDSAALSIAEVLAIALFLALLLKPSIAEAVSRLLLAHAAAVRRGRAAYKAAFVASWGKDTDSIKPALGLVGSITGGDRTYEVRGGVVTTGRDSA